MTATLDKAGGIISAAAEGGFVGGDRLPRGPAPAEGFGAFESRPPRSIRSLSQLRGGAAQSLGVAVRHQRAGVPDNLRNARVPERRDRAAARHRLETRQAETLVTAREQQAPRRSPAPGPGSTRTRHATRAAARPGLSSRPGRPRRAGIPV